MRNGNGKIEVSKPRRIVGWVVWGILYPLLAFAILYNPEKKADSLVATQAASRPAAPPQYICRNENGKTCCAAKVAIGSTATLDVTIKLPPGSHTVSTTVKSDGVEYCYKPGDAEDGAKDHYPVTNPVRSIFDLNRFGASAGNGLTHAGVDFWSKPNEDVVAGIAGKVSIGKTSKGYARVAIIGNGAHGVGEVAYVHLSKIFVSEGDLVEVGRVIATVAGQKRKKNVPEHLHVEVTNSHGEKIDPCSVMECE